MALLGAPSILTDLERLGLPAYQLGPACFFVIASLITIALIWFLRTEYGQAMLATATTIK